MNTILTIRWAIMLTAIACTCGMGLRADGQSVRTPLPIAPRGGTEGVINPVMDVDVATTETGIIAKVFVKPGDRVVAGQPIAELDSKSLRDQIMVKEAEANSKGRIQQAESEMKLAELKFERLTKLRDKGNASAAEFERAEIEYTTAKGKFAVETDQLAVMHADLVRIKNMLEERTIKAPIDGIVTELSKQPGELVAPNAPNLVRIVNTTQVLATLYVQESELSTLSLGSKMKVRLSNGSELDGIVNYIPPIADPLGGLFLVTILIDNPEERTLGSSCQRVK